jgi:hypothetical protein
MGATILLCTNNLVPKRLFETVLKGSVIPQAEANGCDIVIVSHFPVFDQYTDNDCILSPKAEHKEFWETLLKSPIVKASDCVAPFLNVVVGEMEYSLDTICEQLRVGLKLAKHDKVIIMEHDVLYPGDYVSKMIKSLAKEASLCYWKDFVLLCSSGYFKTPGMLNLSRLACTKRFFLDYLDAIMSFDDYFMEPQIPYFDSDSTNRVYDDYGIIANYEICGGDDVLDVKHGLNTEGNIIVDRFYDNHRFWGKASLTLSLIDAEYTAKSMSKNRYAFGLLGG